MKVAWIAVNQICNLRCSWCYERRILDTYQKNMEWDCLSKLLNICKEGNVKKIVFLGGEPTLYPYLVDAILFCKENGIKSEITTNGVRLADMEYLSILRRTGLNSIVLSIKGYDEISYKDITGVNVYNSVMNAIRNIKKINLDLTISIVLTFDFVRGLNLLMSKIESLQVKKCVFSFVKTFPSDEKSNEFKDNNSPSKILCEFLKQKKAIEILNRMYWCIELCEKDEFVNSKQQELIDEKIHISCGDFCGKQLAFNVDGNMISCNMRPDDVVAKINVDFREYMDLITYI